MAPNPPNSAMGKALRAAEDALVPGGVDPRKYEIDEADHEAIRTALQAALTELLKGEGREELVEAIEKKHGRVAGRGPHPLKTADEWLDALASYLIGSTE